MMLTRMIKITLNNQSPVKQLQDLSEVCLVQARGARKLHLSRVDIIWSRRKGAGFSPAVYLYVTCIGWLAILDQQALEYHLAVSIQAFSRVFYPSR